MFRTLLLHANIYIMIFLIFSFPMIGLAQQNTIQAQAIEDAEQDVSVDVNPSLWFIGGCLANFTVVIIANFYAPTPPTSRLLGKSPEYVAYYTDTYQSKAKTIQSKNAMAGCLTGNAVSCCISSFYIFMVINEY